MTALDVSALIVVALRESARESTRGLTSDEVTDAVVGVALAAGWPENALDGVTRRGVAKRLEYLARTGCVVRAGSAFDADNRNVTPVWRVSPRAPATIAPEPPVANAPLPPAARAPATGEAQVSGDATLDVMGLREAIRDDLRAVERKLRAVRMALRQLGDRK